MARAMYTRVGKNEGFPVAYKAPVCMVGEASSLTYQQAKQSRSHSLNWCVEGRNFRAPFFVLYI